MNLMHQNHFKHLLFNDCMITHQIGCNHNAADRSCIYDTFIYNIRANQFDKIYLQEKINYETNRKKFSEQKGYYSSIEDVDNYVNDITERYTKFLIQKSEKVKLTKE